MSSPPRRSPFSPAHTEGTQLGHAQANVLDPGPGARGGTEAPGQIRSWLTEQPTWAGCDPTLIMSWLSDRCHPQATHLSLKADPHQTEWEPQASAPNSPGRSIDGSH